MSQQPDSDTYHTQRLYEPHSSPHAYVNQQSPSQTFFNFNQAIIKLFRCQTELTYSVKYLHQQTTDALTNIAKSSSLQENQHCINDMPKFKVKDPQSFDEWLEQINKVTSLTNKDPYNFENLRDHSAELLVHIHPPWDGTK